MLARLRSLDIVSRLALIQLAVILSYVLFICIVTPLVVGGSFDEYIFSFVDARHVHVNALSLLGALLVGSVVALLTRPLPECKHKQRIMEQVLSSDEQQVVQIVGETGEITQDSLLYRLGWSRPKVSTVITNLERMGVVQRRREGKTYVVVLAKHK